MEGSAPRSTDLQEAGDVPLVAHAHGHHVLEEPEEGPVVALLGPRFVQQAVELEEEAPGALWAGERRGAGISAGGPLAGDSPNLAWRHLP